jgi:hypothetical protein
MIFFMEIFAVNGVGVAPRVSLSAVQGFEAARGERISQTLEWDIHRKCTLPETTCAVGEAGTWHLKRFIELVWRNPG